MALGTYHGSCQCGAVRFTAELDLDKAVTCNCSRCQRMGFVLAFAPADKFTLEAGEGATTEYLFNKHHIRHRFCDTCGVQTFARGTSPDGSEMVAVNVRTLADIEPWSWTAQRVDGRSF